MDLFKQNKYTACYYKLIERAKDRPIPDTYTEKHHIIPKCFYGKYGGILEDNPHDKNNIVILTAKEHYVVHLLLVNMVNEPSYKRKMINAVMQFKQSNSKSGRRITGSMFEQLRKSGIMSGKNNPFYGKGHLMTGEKNHFYGKKHTDDSRRKMSESQTGTHLGEKNHFFGKKHTEASKMVISNKNSGIIKKCLIPFKLISPTGEIFIVREGITQFCKLHNLNVSALHCAAKRNKLNNKTYTSKGWEIFYHVD